MEKVHNFPAQLSLEAVKDALERLKTPDGQTDPWDLLEGDRPVIIENEHGYYRKDSKGYTDLEDIAWQLPLKKAFEEVKHCGPEKKVIFHFMIVQPKLSFLPNELTIENIKGAFENTVAPGGHRNLWDDVDGTRPVFAFSGLKKQYLTENDGWGDKVFAVAYPLSEFFEAMQHSDPGMEIIFVYADSKKVEMVAGFLFTPDKQRVVLIQKQRPNWMAGLLNGLGGKIKPGETPAEAMEREFKEESGLAIKSQWEHFATLEGPDWVVYFFRAFSTLAIAAKTQTDEEVIVMPVYQVRNNNTIANIQWLIPLALCEDEFQAWPLVIPYSNPY